MEFITVASLDCVFNVLKMRLFSIGLHPVNLQVTAGVAGHWFVSSWCCGHRWDYQQWQVISRW